MSERAGSSQASDDDGDTSEAESDEDDSARRIILEEARTAVNQQLSQLDKIDDAAVRTVKIAFLFSSILAGGSQLSPFPELGAFGALGMGSLVTSLLGALYVYGTSRLFVGPKPAELDVDYAESPTSSDTAVEVIDKYEDGIRQNWNTLYVNGFVLAVSRILLGLAVVFVVLGVVYVS